MGEDGVVVVDADHVQGALVGAVPHRVDRLREALAPSPPGRGRPAQGALEGGGGGDAPVPPGPSFFDPGAGVVPGHALAPRHQDVDQHPVELVDAQRHVVGGDGGVGLQAVDDLVAPDVCGEKVVERLDHVGEGEHATGREHPQQVGPEAQRVDLVQRHPRAAPRPQVRHRGLDPRPVAVRSVVRQPEVLAQPGGVGEVMEGDERFETALPARPQDGGVVLQRAVVDLSLGRLDPGPLDTEANGVATQGRGAVEVLVVAVPEVHRQSRRLHPSGVLPSHPVVGGLARAVEAAFDLVPGRGHPEPEPGRQDRTVALGGGCSSGRRVGGVGHGGQHGTARRGERRETRARSAAGLHGTVRRWRRRADITIPGAASVRLAC